jgi:hypothetical protein
MDSHAPKDQDEGRNLLPGTQQNHVPSNLKQDWETSFFVIFFHLHQAEGGEPLQWDDDDGEYGVEAEARNDFEEPIEPMHESPQAEMEGE